MGIGSGEEDKVNGTNLKGIPQQMRRDFVYSLHQLLTMFMMHCVKLLKLLQQLCQEGLQNAMLNGENSSSWIVI
jgi:hypothetical protein